MQLINRITNGICFPGISWYLQVKPRKWDKNLDIWLFPHNPSESPDWNIRADVLTSVLNQSAGANLTKVSKFTWENAKPNSQYQHIIDYSELDGSGFVKDDSIQIFVHLEPDRLIRN